MPRYLNLVKVLIVLLFKSGGYSLTDTSSPGVQCSSAATAVGSDHFEFIDIRCVETLPTLWLSTADKQVSSVISLLLCEVALINN